MKALKDLEFKHFAAQVEDLKPPGLANMLWALATLGLPLCDEAMAALVSSAARLSDRMDAEMLVKTHWALARLRHRPAAGDMQAGGRGRLVSLFIAPHNEARLNSDC